jgi:hypothetical protein
MGMSKALMAGILRNCFHCGKEFRQHQGKSGMCSRRCWQLARIELEGQHATFRNTGGLRRQKPKPCFACKETYVPTASNQVFCRVCCPGVSWIRRIRQFGVTKPMWDKMLAAQNGMCAICDRPPTCVDHCHSTGTVRGLLCGRCNLSLGTHQDESWLEKAKVYLASTQRSTEAIHLRSEGQEICQSPSF